MWLIYTGLFFIIKTVASKDCVCVPYYQCTANDSISTDGSNVIDIRFGEEGETNSNGCQHYLDKCCTPPDGLDLGAGGNVNSNNNGGNNGGGNNGGGNNGGGNTNVQPPPVNTEYKTRGCGFRNRNGIGFRITGSQNGEANFGEFPWMVALITKTLINGAVTNAYTCGASLIDKNVVLTAAHCVFGKAAEDMFIRAGEWDTQTRNEPLPHQDRDVAQIIVHPNYRPGAVWNDYALLVLRSPVILQNNVDTICLPDSQSSFEGVECTATGWGKNEYAAEGKYQVILKSIDLPVVNNRQCETALRTTRLGSFFRLHESFMCAGGVAGKDTCLGDGGSPLVCPLSNGAKDQFVQVGIVSWGIGCGQAGIPGVYADVRKVTDWIRVEVFRILGQINQGGEAGDIRIEQSRNTNL